ncbi:hypothetical protein JKF63_05378 [Porcisia hertigi]|uniref:Transmembrane protein n=1 Tax=Porcisia hertigi TaxID=2761500 RepID=A0A836IBB5_9TRYP|nr:hypothetical protein JKF63_05378 [Porcisia hertigi]
MRQEESPAILFVTTVLSHLTMVPMPYFFYKRNYIFEFCCSLFGLLVSFMYHTTESFNTTIFLSDMQWHRLDNIGIISLMGIWDVYLCCFQNPFVEMSCKCFCIFFTLIVQEKHPWDVRFTVAPILLFNLFPVVKHCIIDKRFPLVDRRQLIIGSIFLGLGIFFFALGLNDSADPYRMYHGAWHFFIGLGGFFFWSMIKNPGCTGHYNFRPQAPTLYSDPAV